MGCNCGKSRPPLGSKQPTPPPPPPSSLPPGGHPATSGQTQQFALDLGHGRAARYGSRLEAEAAFVRAGRRGTVRPI